jgi:uncharacterized protein
MVKHVWHGNTFWLSPQRVMFWEETATLIASDLHLGKIGHFRKSGIALPQELMKQDLIRLFDLLQHFRPKKVLIVGDLFHSQQNKELDWFSRWRNDMAHLDFKLVKGNHDVLDDAWYAENSIDVCSEWQERNLHFVHEQIAPQPLDENIHAVVSGHIHPGITISGAGRQSLRLPCFYFSKQACILPAFGLFTGTYPVKPKKHDVVYAIADQKIIAV